MNFYYPPTSPYMTDALFVAYGGFTGTSTVFMRNASYAIAEAMLEEEIGTFIIPKVITGSFPNVIPNTVIVSPAGMINSIESVVLHERWSDGSERLISGTAYIMDYYSGFFMIDASPNDNSRCVGCTGETQNVYKATIAINAGYATGSIVGNRQIELALALISDIVLKQMYDEGIGQEFWGFVRTSQVGRTITTWSEKFHMDTVFGNSHKAQFIKNLLKNYKIVRANKLGR